MALESNRAEVLFLISQELRTRCCGYLKLRERADDPAPDIIAYDILEQLERCGYRIVREPPVQDRVGLHRHRTDEAA